MALWAGEDDVVDIGSVEVEGVFFGQGVLSHEACGDGFLYLLLEFGKASDAFFFCAVGGAPYGQGGTPEAGAADVPVEEVFEPVLEASYACGFGLPVDRLVFLDELFFAGGGFDEPSV